MSNVDPENTPESTAASADAEQPAEPTAEETTEEAADESSAVESSRRGGRPMFPMSGLSWPASWSPLVDAVRRGMPGLQHAVPAAELSEDDGTYRLEVDLPGVDTDDVTLDVTGRRVFVHAQRAEREKHGTLRRTSRTTGEYDLELGLPTPVDESAVSASMSDGVLIVTLPKSTRSTATRIAIDRPATSGE